MYARTIDARLLLAPRDFEELVLLDARAAAEGREE
jgi:hypothetical protein